jgi:tetratricopeptide (TPR) repeat protein
MKKNKILLVIPLLAIGVVAILFLILFRDRISWHVDQLAMKLSYSIKPPEEEVFIPNTPAARPTLTQTPIPTVTPAPEIIVETAPVIPTEMPTPLPPAANAAGVKYVGQHGLFNYCAPANLAMALSYWGWQGDRVDIGSVVKPFEKDKNVMPYEMADYVQSQTNLGAMVRYGGDLELLKTLIANGFPVLIEKGAWMVDLTNKVSWMGHFSVIDGYDDAQQKFFTKDSYYGPPDYPEVYPIDYDKLESEWRGFNNLFIVLYSYPEEARLLEILGDYGDTTLSNQIALNRADEEIGKLTGVDNVFAWFNKGTSLVQLQDYIGASNAYDQFFLLNAALPESERPWRMVWYQTGPYYAYYFAGRYQDVIDLATKTLDVPQPYLEESWYWRARAYIAMGEREKAIDDLNKSLEYHPNFAPSVALLQELGVIQ